MREEQTNIATRRSDPVEGLGWRLLLGVETSDESVEKILSAWATVASLGRDEDVESGDWPSETAIAEMLPAWMAVDRFSERGYGFDTWAADIEDREFIWWSICRLEDGRVRIDLKAFGMPISVWTIKAVIELAGANLTSSDLPWLLEV